MWMRLLKKIGKSKQVEKYVNLWSNNLNAECDPCWFIAGQLSVAGFLLGWKVGVLTLLFFLGLKWAFPTEHDKSKKQ